MLVNVVFFVAGVCSVAFLAVLPSITVMLSLALLLLTFIVATVVVRRKFAGLIETGNTDSNSGSDLTALTTKVLTRLSGSLSGRVPACFIWGMSRFSTLVCLFTAGFIYAAAHATYQLSLRLPDELLGVEVNLKATVKGLPFHNGRSLQFLGEIESLQHTEGLVASVHGGLLRLNWYGENTPALAAGDVVEATVKLRAPSGFMNPGGFDREKWLLQKRIVATGYVRSKPVDVNVIPGRSNPFTVVRNTLHRRLLEASQGLQAQGVILALSVGDKSAVSRSHWDRFITTGTNHLLAISGLHISLVAAFVALCWTLLWRHTFLSGMVSRQASALTAAMAAAFFYAAMAGFTVTTQRALLMFTVLGLMTLLRRHQRRTLGLAIALLLVCLFDPLSVLAPGMWMSFAAVAVLYLVFSNTVATGGFALLVRILRGHLLISIGLYPLTVLFFQQASLVAPLANLIVTPLVGMLLTPLVFVAMLVALVSVPLATVLLLLVDQLFSVVDVLLQFFSALPHALLKFSELTPLMLTLLCGGAIVMLIPVGFSLRLLTVFFLLPFFFPTTERLEPGEYRVSFLDVGQGTSVLVETRQHVLLYDTGDQFSANFSAADAVIIPYLRSKSINTLNLLIVSHADRDHSGGTDELHDDMKVQRTISSSPLLQFPLAFASPCEKGQKWVWDDVKFEILHPSADMVGSKNDRSCVLQISTPDGLRTLLPGDIESRAEQQLVRDNVLYPLVILLAPHHGSNTSSGNAFIDRLKPDHVVFTTGFGNRYEFPRDQVTARYDAIGTRQFNTADSGAIEFLVSDGQAVIAQEYRITYARWWHRKITGR